MAAERPQPKQTTEVPPRPPRDRSIPRPSGDAARSQDVVGDAERTLRPSARRASTLRAIAAQQEVTRAWLRELQR